MPTVVVDTDIVSFVFKKDKRAQLYRRHLTGRLQVISFMTLAELDAWEPLLPAPNQRGNYPALETLDVLLARDILRHRRRLALSQAKLARRAGIRPEILNRIEKGKRSLSVRTVDKIERALRKAEDEDATK